MKTAQPMFDMAGGGGGGKQDKVKLYVAIGALAVAGVLLAWNFGLLSGKPKAKPLPPPSTEDQQIIDESDKLQREQLQRIENDPTVQSAGA